MEKLYERFRLNEIDRQLVPMKKEDAMMFAKPAKWEIEQLKQGKTINNDRCDATTFKAVVGSALHAIKWTRLDAMTAVFFEATAMHAPTKDALDVAMKTLRFISSPRLMTVSVHAFVRDQHIMKLASPSNAFVLR